MQIMSEIDYYEILEVEDNATQAQIKEAYRRLAFQYHPDRNQAPGSSAKMKSINEAYAVLSNPPKRRDYDAARQQYGSRAYTHFRNAYTDSDIFKGSDINRIFEEMTRAFGFRNFDEIFRETYGEGYRTFEFKRPGFSGRGFIYTGRGDGPQSPPAVLGKLSRYLLRKLTGVDLPEQGADVIETIELTPQEAYDGGPYPFFYKKKSKKLVVKMPSGLREGQRIRLARMGEEGKGGGKRGDLYLKVKIHKPVLERIRDFFSSVKNSYNLPKP